MDIRLFLEAGKASRYCVDVTAPRRHASKATRCARRPRSSASTGKRIGFKVSASDGKKEIGKGSHQRIVIDLRSFNERLAKRAVVARRVADYVSLYCLWKNAECSPPSGGLAAICWVT